MSTLSITTNHHYRHILSWYDLTGKEQEEHKDDYEGVDSSRFFRYRGWVYDLAEFMRLEHTTPEFLGWQGYTSDSYFSGTLVNISECGEAVQVGSYSQCGMLLL